MYFKFSQWDSGDLGKSFESIAVFIFQPNFSLQGKWILMVLQSPIQISGAFIYPDKLFGYLCLLGCVCVCVCIHAQLLGHVWLFVTPWSPSGSTNYGISQARKLEWVAISYSGGSSRSRDRTLLSCISCTDRKILYHCTTWETLLFIYPPLTPWVGTL